MERREFLKLGGLTALDAQTTPKMQTPQKAPAAAAQAPGGKADFTVHIAPIVVGLAEEQAISTMGYNGVAPGPLLRMKEGVRTVVDVINDTDVPEVVHWHGQLIPAEVDGSTEEATPTVPPNGRRRYIFTPRPAGTRWYHSGVSAGPDVTRGLYSGQYGFVYVEPKNDPGQHDHEAFLALKEWQPFFTDVEADGEDAAAPPPKTESGTPSGFGVGYRAFSINDKVLNSSDPMRVKMGDRVLFRLLNASATELRRIALPGHRFQVQALDGNAVPQQKAVEVLQLGPGERVDAVVEMNQPGVWILGCTNDAERNAGMGTIILYQGQKGDPRWVAPAKTRWDYTLFGNATAAASPEPDGRLEINIGRVNGGKGKFNRWTINDKSFPNADPLKVRMGLRYRLAMKNLTAVAQPMHLHRHIFELVSVDGVATAGVMKDTVVVRPYGAVEVEFLANQPGPALLHSHQQIHMDFGLMTMVQYV